MCNIEKFLLYTWKNNIMFSFVRHDIILNRYTMNRTTEVCIKMNLGIVSEKLKTYCSK